MITGELKSKGNDNTQYKGRGFVRHSMVIFAVTAVCIATAAGCAKSPTKAEQTGNRAGYMACTEPRPEACTMQYDPVCGAMTDGRSKTYSNACSACSDPLVNGYGKGACSSADQR